MLLPQSMFTFVTEYGSNVTKGEKMEKKKAQKLEAKGTKII
jgi:hypothetical protein